MNRRHFLATTGAVAVHAMPPWHGLAAAADATPVTKGKTLVVVFLRGGIDGLNLVVPFGDEAYYRHRRTIAIARPGASQGALDLDGFFGLHPSAGALKPLFDAGSCLALQAVGYAQNTRSHFEEQDTWETGVVGNSLSADGWLNRHLASTTGHGVIRAVAIGGNLPRILRGKAPAYAIRGVDDLAMPKTAAQPDAIRAALEHAYCTKPDASTVVARRLAAQTAAATLEGTRQLEAVARAGYEPAHGAKYPATTVATQFREAARLIKSGIGTEIIQIDNGGWDSHNAQGGATGSYANRLRDLTEAIAVFRRDLGDAMNDTLILTLSDFGRTVRENGTTGTDHGWANCMLAIGGSLAKPGKPVIGDWPGLAEEQLQQGRDLRHTTDFRDVLVETAMRHLGNPHADLLMPGHGHKPVGLLG